MYKNIDAQKIAVYSWDGAAGAPKTADAANITAQISKDGAASVATNDVNPTELDAIDHPGIYIFDLIQAETNADLVVITPVSSTADIVIRPIIATPTLVVISPISAVNIIDEWESHTGALSIAYGLLVERTYEMTNNKLTVNETGGAVALRNIGDAADIATGSVSSSSGTTTRAELTWS